MNEGKDMQDDIEVGRKRYDKEKKYIQENQ